MRLFERLTPPLSNASIQLRRGIELLHSRFIREDDAGWVITLPTYRDQVVSLGSGDHLTVWAAAANGLRRYETVVLETSNDKVLLAKPKRAHRAERRQYARITNFINPSAKVDGQNAMLLDLSSLGARILSEAVIRKGERVKLQITDQSCFGWVLDSRGGASGSILRIRFEEPVAIGSVYRGKSVVLKSEGRPGKHS